MTALWVILAAVAVASFPAMLLIEKRIGRGRQTKIAHGLMAAAGAVILAADSVMCSHMSSMLKTPYVGEWAREFFFGYLLTALSVIGGVTALLCVAALIDHKMKRLRLAFALILPVAAVLASFFTAEYAVGGDFPVDVYIRAQAPGLALLPHLIFLCEKEKNSRKNP